VEQQCPVDVCAALRDLVGTFELLMPCRLTLNNLPSLLTCSTFNFRIASVHRFVPEEGGAQAALPSELVYAQKHALSFGMHQSPLLLRLGDLGIF